jgi:hypothetical protein
MTKNTSKLSLANPFTALLALITLFALTAVATFSARRLLGRDSNSQPTQAELLQARSDAIAAIPHLPKDTEEKLAAALDPQLTPITAKFVDPLIDRLGLDHSSTANPRLNSLPVSALSIPAPLVPATPDKIARLIQWRQALRNAFSNGLPAPSITTAYLISEVSPAGRIITSTAQSAWLYIESEKRQIAVNVGAKFYDGVLVSIDRQGLVFRTSAGQTKLMQWDHKDEFSTAQTERPRQQSQPKPPSQSSLTPTLSGKFTDPDSSKPRDDYSDLQDAVRDRYPDKTLPNSGKPEISNDSPEQIFIRTSQPPSPQFSAPTPTTVANPFSNLVRRSKLDFAHAPQTPSRSILNFRTTRAAQLFSLDDPTGIREQSNTTTDTSATPSQLPFIENRAPSPELTIESVEQPAVTFTATPTPETRKTLCDPAYHGENITITNESNRPLSLLTLVNRLNEAYSANIVLDYDVQETPVRLTITNAPWISILRTLLDLNDLDTVCLDGGIVQIAKRTKIASIGDLRRRTAPIIREVFRLKYLQQTAGARANLAGQTQATNGATIQSL